jgi:hypothetical protein
MADPFSSRDRSVSTVGGGARRGKIPGSAGAEGLTLLFLQQADEFLALFRGENLLDTAAAFAQHSAVILPEIVEDGFDLIGLSGGEVEFSLEAVKVEGLALSGLETGRTEAVMDA